MQLWKMKNKQTKKHSLFMPDASCTLGKQMASPLLTIWKNPNISPSWKKQLNPAGVFRLDTSPEQQFRKTRWSHGANSQTDLGLSQPMCVLYFLFLSPLLLPLCAHYTRLLRNSLCFKENARLPTRWQLKARQWGDKQQLPLRGAKLRLNNATMSSEGKKNTNIIFESLSHKYF